MTASSSSAATEFTGCSSSSSSKRDKSMPSRPIVRSKAQPMASRIGDRSLRHAVSATQMTQQRQPRAAARKAFAITCGKRTLRDPPRRTATPERVSRRQCGQAFACSGKNYRVAKYLNLPRKSGYKIPQHHERTNLRSRVTQQRAANRHRAADDVRTWLAGTHMAFSRGGKGGSSVAGGSQLSSMGYFRRGSSSS